MTKNAYYIKSAYKEMHNGMAYLYLDEEHRWTLDPTRIKSFDSEKRAKEISDIQQRICTIESCIIEEE